MTRKAGALALGLWLPRLHLPQAPLPAGLESSALLSAASTSVGLSSSHGADAAVGIMARLADACAPRRAPWAPRPRWSRGASAAATRWSTPRGRSVPVPPSPSRQTAAVPAAPAEGPSASRQEALGDTGTGHHDDRDPAGRELARGVRLARSPPPRRSTPDAAHRGRDGGVRVADAAAESDPSPRPRRCRPQRPLLRDRRSPRLRPARRSPRPGVALNAARRGCTRVPARVSSACAAAAPGTPACRSR